MVEPLRGASPDVSVVIVNWNSADYVAGCIRSIKAATLTVRCEVVVVDNASFDGCQQRLAAEHPDVVFVQSQQNLGFGRANNLGARHARGDVLLFLNPDTEVRAGAIDGLYAELVRHADAGIVGCRLLNTDGSLQTSCVQALPTVLNQVLDADVFRRLTPRAAFWGTTAFFAPLGQVVEVEAVSGACMMVRREVFQRVGGFSPAFFMYGEDLDLCGQVSRAGFRNLYVGGCEIVHFGGGSSRSAPSSFSIIMMCESVALVLRRYRGALSGTLYRVAMAATAAVRLLLLVLVSPVWVAAKGMKTWRDASRKWLTVLGWGLGLHRAHQAAVSVHAKG